MDSFNTLCFLLSMLVCAVANQNSPTPQLASQTGSGRRNYCKRCSYAAHYAPWRSSGFRARARIERLHADSVRIRTSINSRIVQSAFSRPKLLPHVPADSCDILQPRSLAQIYSLLPPPHPTPTVQSVRLHVNNSTRC